MGRYSRRDLALLLAGPLPALAQPVPAARLRPESVAGFNQYWKRRVEQVEARRIRGAQFLWSDEQEDRKARVWHGEVVVEPVVGQGSQEVRGALIHDWIGGAFLPGVQLAQALAVVKNYNAHKTIYAPEVMDSRILKSSGDEFRVYLRLMKKKIVTVVLNTEHEVKYFEMGGGRVHSRSEAVRISEVDEPGSPNERPLPAGEDHGFLWRLNSMWRFLDRDGGVWIECEAVSLSRGVPLGFGWLITPIVRDLPRESLERTIEGTRRALRR